MAIDANHNTNLSLLNSRQDGSGLKARREQQKQKIAWRMNVVICALGTLLIACINIATLVWTKVSFPSGSDGATIIYAGSCETSKRIKLWVDLAVNIISTLLLAASTYCMQVLTSPLRSEIDKAHSRGKWMDIGVPSIRNLTKIAGWRVILWMTLATSSIPLHFFYNSVFFNTIAANDYQAALVTHDFLAGGWWNETGVVDSLKNKAYGESSKWMTLLNDYPRHHVLAYLNSWVTLYPEQLHYSQNHVDSLVRLDNKDCLQAYGTSLFESRWRNVLVVGNITAPDNVIKVWIHSPIDGIPDEDWICQGNDPDVQSDYGSWSRVSCDVHAVLDEPSSWTIHDVRLCSQKDVQVDQCPKGSVKVDYCLAEPSNEHCTVRVNTYLLMVVIACNVLKLTALLFMACSRSFEPLANVGDAVASFLNCPDEQTRGIGPISIMDIRSGKRDISSRPFRRRARRWAAAVSVWRWIACSFLFVGLMAGGLALFFCARRTGGDQSLPKILSQGIGSVSVNNLVGSPDKNMRNAMSFLPGVLLANTPQVFVSFADLLFNNVFTCMVLAYEWSSFATTRKGLRVSRRVRQSEQRSTLKLQVPYRYIIPMKSVMPVLHWLVASSIFYLQFMPYSVSGAPLAKAQIAACAYSPPAIFYALLLGGSLILILYGISLRGLPPGMPVAGYCSMAISAACHAGADEDDVTLKSLQYGVVARVQYNGSLKERVGFSSRDVRPLLNGAFYE